jgi:uncharacterized membrane protein
MAVVHESFTVGTSPVLIAEIPAKNPTTSVHIVNDDNNSVYIGDSTVTTSGADKGLTVKKDSVYTLELNALDKLYAVAAVATGANAVSVVYSKVI